MMDIWQDRDWTPMLLGEVSEPFDSEDYIFELKFDGTRTIIFVSPDEIKVFNRRKMDITYLYPELDEIRSLVKRKTIFDGEIIAMENGAPSFQKLQKRAHLKDKRKIKYQSENNPVIFVCYDILYDGKNLIDKEIGSRKKLLEKYEENDVFIKSKYIEKDGIKLYKNVEKMNLEGIVAKKKGSIYEISRRSNSWLKIKNLKVENFYIGGYIDKNESFVISLIIGEYREDKLYYVGKVTLGKKTTLYKKIINKKTILKSPFSDFTRDDVIYLEPNLTCKVNYMERTKNFHLRQPFIRHG